ncbi:MAG: DUF2520 domain-containing protein [Azoarcus sp.]|jgi:predicted short-subunit dehydrogenase-like oxidoreductase (DUF2520 family)|nr:DUF2520 domain-containing protein [Azoarcus sp.]
MPIPTIPTLNLIGPGRLGRSLARLWHDTGLVQIGAVAGRHAKRCVAARDFIGAGTPMVDDPLPPADLWLIATPDDAIAGVATGLAADTALRTGDIAFHCSGALASDVLAPLQAIGAHTASVHPLKSFAAPDTAITSFDGTFCACEGAPDALQCIAPLFDAIGARRFSIDAEHKLRYHAAAVLACNHLVALMEAALRCMEGAGVDRETAWSALQPLVAGTLSNIDRNGTRAALTGPVARGDKQTIRDEIDATRSLAPELGEAYRVLSLVALGLAPPENGLTRDDISAS